MLITIQTSASPSFLDQLAQIASITQAIVTAAALLVAGWWTYWKFVHQLEAYAHIETSAEIEIIGHLGDAWLVEVRAVLVNKGKVENRISGLDFDLVALFEGDVLTSDPELWNGQVAFPHPIASGTFLRSDLSYFSLGPGITAKYSHVTKVPLAARFLMLHCWFDYLDGRNLHHSMEKTVRVPKAAEFPLIERSAQGRSIVADPSGGSLS
jgi:hypothetical protein